MKTDIHIQHTLEKENCSIRFEANVKDAVFGEDKKAAVISALAEGIKAFAEDNDIPIMAMATILLHGMGCMTEEDANEAVDMICAGEETEDTENDSCDEEEKDEPPCLDNIDALKKAVDEFFDKLYEKK